MANPLSGVGGGSQAAIGGGLPWGSAGGGAGMFSGGAAGLGASYAGAYNSALAFNQANYQNILSGYQGVLGRQTSAEQAIQGGYGRLYDTVMAGIQGVGASQGQEINDTYAQQAGAATQGLVDRGLGNTTVQNSVQRGLLLDKNKAQVALSNQIAQLQAGYQSNLGLAGLGYANQSAMQDSAQGGRQLDWMNSVNAPYPNASAYAQMAQQYGAADQADKDRAAVNRGLPGGGAPNLNYEPAGGSLGGVPQAQTGGYPAAGGGGSYGGYGAVAVPNVGPAGYGAGAYGGVGNAITSASDYMSGGGGGWMGNVAANLTPPGGGWMGNVAANLSPYGDYGGGADFEELPDYGGGGEF